MFSFNRTPTEHQQVIYFRRWDFVVRLRQLVAVLFVSQETEQREEHLRKLEEIVPRVWQSDRSKSLVYGTVEGWNGSDPVQGMTPSLKPNHAWTKTSAPCPFVYPDATQNCANQRKRLVGFFVFVNSRTWKKLCPSCVGNPTSRGPVCDEPI